MKKAAVLIKYAHPFGGSYQALSLIFAPDIFVIEHNVLVIAHIWSERGK